MEIFHWRYLIPALFAVLAGLFAYLAWDRGRNGHIRTPEAKKSYLRIAAAFSLVCLFLLLYLHC